MPATDPSLNARLRAMPAPERERILLDVVTECTAGVLGHHDPAELEPDLSFPEADVDSLTATEIRSRIAARVGMPVPRTRFDARTTVGEAARILNSMLGESATAPPQGKACREEH
ncbi:acyl carrier protein [Streptomyces axinellae]|uniref:Carrier domain-containing protein n=1 Tax=Streptomyces axinellae TaxID=552788 RepID=A0ABN3Q597_9ACTN